MKAIEIYDARCGFKTIKAVKLKSHELIPQEGGCLLLKYEI